MRFAPEPAYRHGQPPRTALVLINLGTPDAPDTPSVRRYLAEFLSDPRVIEIPRLIWWPVLHGIILRVRPRKSAAKYASIWMEEGSPLAVWTKRQADALGERLTAQGQDVTVTWAMRYGKPNLATVLDGLKASGHSHIALLPLYPQYCAATTATAVDVAAAWLSRQRHQPHLRWLRDYAGDAGYIAALAARVRAHWATQGARGERLVMSFHGMPAFSLDKGDPYHCQCYKTARLLEQALELAPGTAVVTFQSRFGRAKWLQPYTEPTLVKLAGQGVRSVDVICPGFVADCIETLEEINMEAREAFLAAGGTHFAYIPCLNDSPEWLDALTALAQQQIAGWPGSGTPGAGPVAGESAVQRERHAAVAAALAASNTAGR
ncbi:ferrochelatase [Amphibiibacter pelophylacis]|uniref:Ferrochelatase n=1 Tax=Amphibiibacter pelophylacis TaxID=1799477 RepID=A0ACC6NZK5_9BURK